MYILPVQCMYLHCVCPEWFLSYCISNLVELTSNVPCSSWCGMKICQKLEYMQLSRSMVHILVVFTDITMNEILLSL